MATELAKKTEKTTAVTIKQLLSGEQFREQVASVLPECATAQRFVRVALTTLTRTPKLAQCEQASFFRCLLDLAQWGLEPDGRRAHLIPFENRKRGVTECQLIIDYKGLVELAYRSGVVKSIHADVVRRGDIFAFNLGNIEAHVPWFLRTDQDKPDKPGEVFAAYARCVLDDGAVSVAILSHDEVESIRKRSRAGNAGPWVTDWQEMAKKTAFRRLSKWIPLSAEMREAMDRDDDVIDGTCERVRKPMAELPDLALPASEEDPIARDIDSRNANETIADGELSDAEKAEIAAAEAAEAEPARTGRKQKELMP